ncbi:MAG: class II aldolase/adducin family protein [Chloroflexi bacterium]|nr:class II aldolase/adducin family protein [Chloroflexota bacterium]MBI3733454.1 class II aldolase/adducin family protein [Chloroflexota bacterium]
MSFVNEHQLRQEIVEIGRRMWEKGFLAAADGNLSARIGPDRLLITPSGLSKGFLSPDQILRVSLDGAVLASNHPGARGLKPSSEMMMHLEAYKQRADVSAVIHAHPPLAIALTVAGLPLDADVLPEVIYSVGIIPTAPYVTPGTPDGQRAVSELVKVHDAILLDHHGTLTVGASLTEAYMRLERVEHSAAILLAARQVGELKRLPRAEFEKLCALGVCARQNGLHAAASEELPEALVQQVVTAVLKQMGH